MAIETIENHTREQYYHQIRMLKDSLARADDQVDQLNWDKGTLDYVLDQLDKARRFLFAARSVAQAQILSVAGFKILDVRSEV